MTIFSKTIRSAELPDAWRKEIGVDGDRLLKISIEEVASKRSLSEIETLLEGLRSIIPVNAEGDVTSFNRSERDRLDGRSTGAA